MSDDGSWFPHPDDDLTRHSDAGVFDRGGLLMDISMADDTVVYSSLYADTDLGGNYWESLDTDSGQYETRLGSPSDFFSGDFDVYQEGRLVKSDAQGCFTPAGLSESASPATRAPPFDPGPLWPIWEYISKPETHGSPKLQYALVCDPMELDQDTYDSKSSTSLLDQTRRRTGLQSATSPSAVSKSLSPATTASRAPVKRLIIIDETEVGEDEVFKTWDFIHEVMQHRVDAQLEDSLGYPITKAGERRFVIPMLYDPRGTRGVVARTRKNRTKEGAESKSNYRYFLHFDKDGKKDPVFALDSKTSQTRVMSVVLNLSSGEYELSELKDREDFERAEYDCGKPVPLSKYMGPMLESDWTLRRGSTLSAADEQ